MHACIYASLLVSWEERAANENKDDGPSPNLTTVISINCKNEHVSSDATVLEGANSSELIRRDIGRMLLTKVCVVSSICFAY